MTTQKIIDRFKNKINETKQRETFTTRNDDEVEYSESQDVSNKFDDINNKIDDDIVSTTSIEDNQSEKIGSIFVNDEVYKHIFFPQSDITIFELARILSFTQMLISDNIYDKIPADLKRHFTKFTDKI